MAKLTVTVPTWTGHEANLLRQALRQPQNAYAETVGVSPRTVANWAAKGRKIVLSIELQQAFDRELERLEGSDGPAVERFAALLAGNVGVKPLTAEATRTEDHVDDGLPNREASWESSKYLEQLQPKMPVSDADISAIRAMLVSLTTTDHQFGGGFARRAASGYLHEIVRPRLCAPGPDAIQRPFKAAAAEFQMRVAWMHLDVADSTRARAAARDAFSLAQQSGDLAVCAWAMAMTALLETWLGDTNAAVAYGHAAAGLALAGPHLVRAFAHGKLARALAAAGDGDAARRELLVSRTEFDSADAGQHERVPETIRNSYDAAYVLDEEAHCFRDMGLDRKAMNLSQQSLRLRGEDRFTRNRAFATGNHALSLARLGEIDVACDSAANLVRLATSLSSRRVLERLSAVRLALAPYQAVQAVAELEDLIHSTRLDAARHRSQTPPDHQVDADEDLALPEVEDTVVAIGET